MELSRENLEKLLKIHMDKLKQKLGLEYSASIYTAKLSDHMRGDAELLQGEVVTIRIKTDFFVAAINAAHRRKLLEIPAKTPEENEFNELLERILRVVPRMIPSLSNLSAPYVAELIRNEETGKRSFKKLNRDQYEERKHPYEKEIHFGIDYRCTAIHWKSGTIIRDFGKDRESATDNARERILRLLSDETIYNRTNSNFQIVEPHEDIIYDLVMECKVFSQDEIRTLIHKLEEEYLKSND